MQVPSVNTIAETLTSAIPSALSSALTGAADNSVAASASGPFSGLIREAVRNESALEKQATDATDGLMQGTGVDVHEAMIATQKADMAFELALAVRGKAIAAYQQVMGMQF